MPIAALKHLAKKAGISIEKAEHLWDKAKDIVDDEYNLSHDDEKYWALRMGITKKMMGIKEMISFKEFIVKEASFGVNPTVKPIDVADAIKLLNEKCRDALWMLYEDRPIFRGDDALDTGEHGFATVDPSLTIRQSENTTNYYTIILDNIKSREGWPKRSRSYIASTASAISSGYGDMHILIPFDGVKIGAVNKKDMWETQISLYGERMSIDEMNNLLETLVENASWTSFLKTDKLLRERDSNKILRLNKVFKWIDDVPDHFIDDLDKAYSPKATGHTLHTTDDLPHGTKQEVWIGGPCVVISLDMWENLRDAVKNA